MSTETQTFISPETYLALEAQAEYKSEYRNGEIVAMAGAQLAHNQIVNNLIFLINRCLWDKDCQAFPSDLLLKMPERCNQYVYPDITIVCGEVKVEKYKGLDVLLNPTVVIEILSSSTRTYDQSEKMECYLALESLRQYIMVDSEKIEVASYTQTAEKDWLYQTLKSDQHQIKINDCEINLDEIYRNVKFVEQ